MIFSISTTILLFSLSVSGASIRYDFPWMARLTVSDIEPGNEYEGEVEILAIFENKIYHATTLPSTKYESGRMYAFPVRMTSAGPLEALYIRTKGYCPLGVLPNNVLRLKSIQLISKSTNLSYTKQTGDLAIKDVCQNPNNKGTELIDFSFSKLDGSCLVDGKRYENGQQFEMGCVGRCQCENGSIACVDMCGTVAWEPHRKCHFAHTPGQCCDRVICEDDAHTNKCGEPSPADTAEEQGAPAVRRYPWAVMYCVDDTCKQIQAGVIVGSRHILAFAPDLSELKQVGISAGQYIVDQQNTTDFTITRIANVSTHPDFINKQSPIADSSSRLQLVELDPPFQFTRQLQAANLPFDLAHCSKLSKSSCPVMGVGWDLTDDTEPAIRQWFLHTDKGQRDQHLCQSNSTSTDHPAGPVRRGDKRVCMGGLIGRSDCTGPLGGVGVATAARTDFVVGLMDPDASLFYCDHPGTADLLPLCNYLEWIHSIIKDI